MDKHLNESDQTRDALFPNSSKLFDHVASDPPKFSKWSEEFHSSFVKKFGSATKQLSDIANVLIFTQQEKALIDDLMHFHETSEPTRSWIRAELESANHFTKVLLANKPTRYPDVDSPSLPLPNPKDGEEYLSHLWTALTTLSTRSPSTSLLDRLALIATIHQLNDLGRFARNLSLQSTANLPALALAETLDFTLFPYAAVLILGHSPTPAEALAGKPLSEMSIRKLDLALDRNRDFRLAPFYICCGGPVRPRNTPFVEAVAMKAYLLEQHGVAEGRVLIDATSEHTYSNFMNAVLIAGRMGVPLGKRMVSFLLEEGGQYEFVMEKMYEYAQREVWPDIKGYFAVHEGPEEWAVEVEGVGDTGEFLGRGLVWRDYEVGG